MLTVAKLRRKPRHFINFTGLSLEQFDALLVALTPLYEQAEHQRLNRPHRRRAVGAGHQFHLAVSDRLLLTLLYHRLYVSGTLLSYLFNLHESNISREINQRMRPRLMQVLPLPVREQGLEGWLRLAQDKAQGKAQGKAHQKRKQRIGTLAELLEAYPEFAEVWADATEQEVPKPKAKEPRRTRYSGKAKCHTVKTQVVMARLSSNSSNSSNQPVILHVLGGMPGSLHDHTLLRASGVLHQLPPGVIVRLDRAYEAVEAEHPQVRVAKPKRARRNKPLNALEHICNQVLSRLRMPVEHGLGRLKKWSVLAGLYRGRWKEHEDVFCLICGLHNYKMLGQLHWFDALETPAA